MNSHSLIYNRAFEAWLAAEDFRRRRRRNKQFTFGNQWSERIFNGSKFETEESEAIRHGRKPLTNNLIGQLVRTIVGRYRAAVDAADLYNDGISRRNALRELDGRMMEEFLISGAAVQKISLDERNGTPELWVDNVDLRRFFVNPYRDLRGLDIDIIGQLHDLTPEQIVSKCAPDSPSRAEAILDLCRKQASMAPASSGILGNANDDDPDFHFSDINGKIRLVEVWSKELFRNSESGKVSPKWICRLFLGRGELLQSFPSPYLHGSHPYAVKHYPLTDGEVHSYVESLVDNQRYINRLITLVDHIMATSAKGALLFPTELVPENFDIREIALRWASPDAIIPINTSGPASNAPMPTQITSKGTADGAYRLLETQLRLFEKESGVNEVLTGNTSPGNTGNEAYKARLEAAGIVLLDILETFADFRDRRDAKIVAL